MTIKLFREKVEDLNYRGLTDEGFIYELFSLISQYMGDKASEEIGGDPIKS